MATSPTAVVPQLVFVPLKKLCGCCDRCQRLAGYYRIVWQLDRNLPAEMQAKLARHLLFGKVVCAN